MARRALAGTPAVSPELGPLSPGRIHVWIVDDRRIVDRALLDRYRSWLSESERAQMKRFVFAPDRHQYLVTRALVRYTLSRYRPHIAEPEWRFRSNYYGRPSIANARCREAPLAFNLSHTKGLVVLALATNGELGVDTESRHRMNQIVKLGGRFMAPAEHRDFLALPEPERVDRCLGLWTLKEAYVKARGMGMSIPLDSFAFSFPRQGQVSLSVTARAEDTALGWRLWQIDPTEEHRVSIAYRDRRGVEPVRVQVGELVPLHSSSRLSCAFRSTGGDLG